MYVIESKSEYGYGLVIDFRDMCNGSGRLNKMPAQNRCREMSLRGNNFPPLFDVEGNWFSLESDQVLKLTHDCWELLCRFGAELLGTYLFVKNYCVEILFLLFFSILACLPILPDIKHWPLVYKPSETLPPLLFHRREAVPATMIHQNKRGGWYSIYHLVTASTNTYQWAV